MDGSMKLPHDVLVEIRPFLNIIRDVFAPRFLSKILRRNDGSLDLTALIPVVLCQRRVRWISYQENELII